VERYGADSVRFALMNSPVMSGESVAFGDDLVEEVYKKNIQRIENVVDFYKMYSQEVEDENNIGSDNILDKWILARLGEVIKTSIDGYENYRLDIAVSKIPLFIDDLSTWYLRRSRDRIKEGDKKALFTLKYVLNEFSKVIAPAMPFLAERIYKEVNNTEDSVHLQSYPKQEFIDEVLVSEMSAVRDIVTDLLMLRQKNNVPVRQPLLSATINRNIDQKYHNLIQEEINVKNIIINDKGTNDLDFNLNEELITEGKQRELSRQIKDKRKELGLVAEDYIVVTVKNEQIELLDEEYKTSMNIKEVKVGESVNVDKIL
ncbi:MAG: isoleucyl-tRNA synthetase, partial [Patescibacteria group bacterium]|nr:isoleucyl-tRNA synthetase [Patescibacteria group bacterium]